MFLAGQESKNMQPQVCMRDHATLHTCVIGSKGRTGNECSHEDTGKLLKVII
jgi:hypothetical protein